MKLGSPIISDYVTPGSDEIPDHVIGGVAFSRNLTYNGRVWVRQTYSKVITWLDTKITSREALRIPLPLININEFRGMAIRYQQQADNGTQRLLASRLEFNEHDLDGNDLGDWVWQQSIPVRITLPANQNYIWNTRFIPEIQQSGNGYYGVFLPQQLSGELVINRSPSTGISTSVLIRVYLVQ